MSAPQTALAALEALVAEANREPGVYAFVSHNGHTVVATKFYRDAGGVERSASCGPVHAGAEGLVPRWGYVMREDGRLRLELLRLAGKIPGQESPAERIKAEAEHWDRAAVGSNPGGQWQSRCEGKSVALRWVLHDVLGEPRS